MIKRFFALGAALAALCLPVGAQVPAGFIPLTSTRLVDATGQPVASATVCAQSVSGTQPMSVNVAGLGNTTTPPVCVQATNGGWSMNLPDGALSSPLNATFSITATDNVSGASLLYGFSAVQPHSQTCSVVSTSVQCAANGPADFCSSNSCNFDRLAPSAPARAMIVQGQPGAPGQQGATGLPGANGTTTYDGSNGPFAVGGSLTLKPTNSQFNQPQGISRLDDINTSINKFGPGTNLTGVWTNSHMFNGTVYNSTRGIKQGEVLSLNNIGVGDAAGGYLYNTTVAPGILNGDDEAAIGLAAYVQEQPYNFLATIGSTSGTGDTQPGFTNVSGLWAPPDQGILLDLSKGTVSGAMTARSTTFENYLQQMPLTVTAGGSSLPLTTAWGTATQSLPYGQPENAYQTATFTVTLRAINGSTPAFTSGYARVFNFARTEMVPITAGAVSNGTQQVTIQYRYGQNGTMYLFQGGLAGQFMSWDGDFTFSGKYLPRAVAGSIDGTNIIFADYMLGASNKNGEPLQGVQGADPTVPSRAGYHLFPGAETTANLSAPGVNPVVSQVEANVVPWATGDSVVGTGGSWWGGATEHLKSVVYTPTSPSFGQQGLWLESDGQGVSSSYAHIRVTQKNPPSWYRSGGGPLDKPSGIAFDSQYDTESFRQYMSFPHPVDPLSMDSSAGLLAMTQGNQDYTGTPYTGSTTTGSNIVTLQPRLGTNGSDFGLHSGDPISGPGIPAGTVLGSFNYANGWSMTTTAGANVTATSTTASSTYTVQANRYYILRSADGGSIIQDVQRQRLVVPGSLEVDGQLTLSGNGGLDTTNSLARVGDTFGNTAQSDTQAVNTESLQNLLSAAYVGTAATKYTGSLRVVTGVSSNGASVTTSTMHFTNGIMTGITTP